MKSLIRIVAVLTCLLAWRAECQNQAQGDSGLYVTPAYNGDVGGTYVSPAFSGGSFETAPGTGAAPGVGPGGRREAGGRARYELGNPGAYSTPAFSAPTLGILVSPPAVQKPKPKSSKEKPKAAPADGATPVKPSGTSEQQPENGGPSTNRLENLTLPPSTGTNATQRPDSNLSQ